MRVPQELQEITGLGFKKAYFQKINEIIEYLRSIVLTADNRHIALDQTASGITIRGIDSDSSSNAETAEADQRFALIAFERRERVERGEERVSVILARRCSVISVAKQTRALRRVKSVKLRLRRRHRFVGRSGGREEDRPCKDGAYHDYNDHQRGRFSHGFLNINPY